MTGKLRLPPSPSWHIRTDGVWQLAGPAEITSRPAGATPTITELRHGRVAGQIQPQGKEYLPHPEFLAWPRAEVFKEPAREWRGLIGAGLCSGARRGRIYEH